MNAIALKLECSLTDLEWRVVEIARSDGPRTINPEGRLTRFLREFFGLPISRNLANEKLEALRRFCVRAWFWDLIRSRDVREVIEAGYTSVDVFQILAHVAGYRGFTPTIEDAATA
jgi:hypothetical protein